MNGACYKKGRFTKYTVFLAGTIFPLIHGPARRLVNRLPKNKSQSNIEKDTVILRVKVRKLTFKPRPLSAIKNASL